MSPPPAKGQNSPVGTLSQLLLYLYNGHSHRTWLPNPSLEPSFCSTKWQSFVPYWLGFLWGPV